MNSISYNLLVKARHIFTQEQLAGKLGRGVRTIRRWERGEINIPEMAIDSLRKLLSGSTNLQDPLDGKLPDFRFIDLFAGIGGTRQAFEANGGKCVFTSEWDRFACQTYRENFSDDHEISGDITLVGADEIPDHEVLVAGFPCQPFSLAGVSKKNSLGRAHGFSCETQGTLFFDIARIIEAKRPRAFLLENVKNLRGHDKGRTFEIIKKTLTVDLGYTVSERVIDAASFVPQHRERIFIVGFREPCGFDWDSVKIPSTETGPSLRTILHGFNEHENSIEEPYSGIRRGRIRAADKYTLTDKLWKYLQDYAAKHARKGNGFGCSVVTPDDHSRTLSARYHKDGSEILIKEAPNQRRNPRRLTPRECARLMGFPDSFRIPVSDTQAYRQFGNSVVVPVVKAVSEAMTACVRGTPLSPVPEGEQLLLSGSADLALSA
ncbi:DNA (cytosine-5-)-methyltransferase [Verrucomicrobia bacterium]|nr:DNA (cytosine-5-)-methyltransferase [Verrucomicrobiota bacterium]